MIAKSITLALSISLLACLAGCSDAPPRKVEPTWDQAAVNPIVPANYKAAG